MSKKLRALLLAGSVLWMTVWAAPGFAQESTPPSSEMTYREYLEGQRKLQAESREADAKMNAEAQHAALVQSVIVLAIVVGLIAFLMVGTRRRQKKFMELAEKQQRTLEEIRDLLKKP